MILCAPLGLVQYISQHHRSGAVPNLNPTRCYFVCNEEIPGMNMLGPFGARKNFIGPHPHSGLIVLVHDVVIDSITQ